MDVGTPPLVIALPGQSTLPLEFTASSRGGYQTSVNVGCNGLPGGFACRLGSTTVDVPAGTTNRTTIVIDVGAAVPIGDYIVNVVASDIAITQTFPITVHVGDFALKAFATASAARPSGQQFFRVEVQSINHGGGGVQFSCAGLPVGAGCDLAPNITGATTEDFSINTNNLPVGDYPFTVLGTVGSIVHSANATLRVGDFGTTTISPASATLAVGQSATFNLTVSSVNGFNDTVNLICSPSLNGRATNGVRCSFSPSPATFDASGKLTTQMTVTISAVPRSGNVSVQAATAQRGCFHLQPCFWWGQRS
jgi:hypothetical protein